MGLTIHNHVLQVGHIEIIGITTSSVFLVGDNESIVLSSIYDTPPESLIISPTGIYEEETTNEEANNQGE
ncbi:spore gernimation protein GerPD [Bacillaceae bacterium S4-13-58]